MKRRIKLRIQQTRYPHWGKYSGIGQYLNHLDPTRYRIETRVAADDDTELPLPHPNLRPWLREKVQREGMAWYKLSDLAAELRILGACAVGQVDVVHFLDGEHTGQYLPQWLDRLPGRRPRLVVSYHQPVDLLPQLVRPEIVTRFDQVVLVSQYQRPFFEAFMPAGRITTIPHGIDTDFFMPASSFAGEDGVFRCISAGHWLRDWPTIREVAARLQHRTEIEFHIVTGQPTGLEGLPNVHFHSKLSDEGLRSLYQRSSALFLPLTGSTANNSVLEAIACALPVISTDLPAVRAYIGKGTGFLLAPGDVERSVAAIERLCTDAALRRSMSQAARARAEQLSWPIIARQYDMLYAQLLSA